MYRDRTKQEQEIKSILLKGGFEMLKYERDTMGDTHYLGLKVLGITAKIYFSWSYNMGRFGSQSNSYVVINFPKADTYDMKGFNRKNKVRIDNKLTARKVMDKVQLLATEVVNWQQAEKRKKDAEHNKIERLTELFEKTHAHDDISVSKYYNRRIGKTESNKFTIEIRSITNRRRLFEYEVHWFDSEVLIVKKTEYFTNGNIIKF